AAVVKMLATAESAEAVTNDHFDEDGLMSVIAMMEPGLAFEHGELMIDVASCGDFGVVGSRAAAAVAFSIGPLAEAEAGTGAGTSERYLAVLPRTEDLLVHPEKYESFWAAEMAVLDEGEAALSRGDVEITEDIADLAVVSRVGGTPVRFAGASGGLPIHAVAVHSATNSNRILAFDGQRCELYLRYESWVRFVSRAMPLRPDLEPLAAILTAREPGDVAWEANGVGAIVGRLHPTEGMTELAPPEVLAVVRDYLSTAPPAWDPHRPGGSRLPSSGAHSLEAGGGKARARRERGAGSGRARPGSRPRGGTPPGSRKRRRRSLGGDGEA
ncbi:MAG: DUF6687 family protein, partial [Acidimicrobiales bacterium]